MEVNTSYGLFVAPDVIGDGDDELGIMSEGQLSREWSSVLATKAAAQAMRAAWQVEEDAIKVAAQGNAAAMVELETRARAEEERKAEERERIAKEKSQAEDARNLGYVGA